MIQIKPVIFFIFCFLFLEISNSNTLYDLEKLHSENEEARQNLSNDIQATKRKIIINESAIAERKQDLAKFLKADQQLNQFQFGGILAIEDSKMLNRNLNIFEKIKNKNLTALRELKYYSEDLNREQLLLLQKNESLALLNEKLVAEEKKLVAEEKKSLDKIKQDHKDSLLMIKGYLSEPIQSHSSDLKSTIQFHFGHIQDVKNQYSVNHKGITYIVKLDQIVQAVGPGKIIFRDAIKYWGESVIIQHAGDYYSVYTNLKNCRIEKDQNVSQSEKICETAANEFYFELRNQNIAINPKKWIRN